MSHFYSTSTIFIFIFVCPNLLRMVNAGDKEKGHTIIVKSGENDRYGYGYGHHVIPIPVPVPIHHHGHHFGHFARRSGPITGSSTNNLGETTSSSSSSSSSSTYTPSPFITPFGSGLPFPLSSWMSQSMMSPLMSQSLMSPASIYQLMFGNIPHVTHRSDTLNSNDPSNEIIKNGNSDGENNENTDSINNNEQIKSSSQLSTGHLYPVFAPDYPNIISSSTNQPNNGLMWKFTPYSDSNDYWTSR